jgi:hypothetical protein
MSSRVFTFTTTAFVQSNESTVLNLMSSVDILNAAVPLTYLHMTPVVPALTLPLLGFTYQVKASDGLLWTQTITFASQADPDPQMTFSVLAGWKLSEFAQQRTIRDMLIKCVNLFGASTIKFDFT